MHRAAFAISLAVGDLRSPSHSIWRPLPPSASLGRVSSAAMTSRTEMLTPSSGTNSTGDHTNVDSDAPPTHYAVSFVESWDCPVLVREA